MNINRDFLKIFTADFLARSAYQMGKTPLLPILALSLGASDAYLGFIVSVSTLTGMFLKPLIGILSDRDGRRRWLIIGTLFFALMPFVYWFVHTPTQLFIVRIVHGLATAIYGPVTLAYVAEQKKSHTAERLGWFGLARSGGYIVGPALAGWLLLYIDPVMVFTIVGFISCLTFIPVMSLPETLPVAKDEPKEPLKTQFKEAMLAGSKTPAIWLAGGLEAAAYIGLYALKAFLPIYALSLGVNTAVVGLFFSLQETVHIIFGPLGGRLGDKYGYTPMIALGMMVLGGTLPLLGLWDSATTLLALSLLLGLSQALIFSSTVALISERVDKKNLGAGLGFLGTLQNGGKVAGPVLGGLLITYLDYQISFYVLGGFLLIGALLLGGYSYWHSRPQEISGPTAAGN